MTIAAILIGFIVFAVTLRLAAPLLSSKSAATGRLSVNGETQLGDCPDTPNCQGSESSRQEQTLERFELTKSATETLSAIADIISAQAGAAIVHRDERYIHATFTTRLMGYIDDVEFLISDDDQSVQVRSASRLGKSDLGANAKRVELLRQLTRAAS